MSILEKARDALGMGAPTDIPAFLRNRPLLVPPDQQLPAPDGAEQAIADALATTEPAAPITEEPEPMSNPATPSATAEPAAHIESLKIGIETLRATEADLIEDIKAQMQRLANTQHAIRAYQSTIRELEQAVSEPMLEPTMALAPAPTPAT